METRCKGSLMKASVQVITVNKEVKEASVLRGPLCWGCYSIIEGPFYIVGNTTDSIFVCPTCMEDSTFSRLRARMPYDYVRENCAELLYIPEYLDEQEAFFG